MKGMVFGIQRFSLEDGPGIRTTVFLNGCTLHCPWCHNPESWQCAPQVLWRADRCMGCGRCATVCPSGVHQMEDGTHLRGRAVCAGCGRCVRVCPGGALAVRGHETDMDTVLEQVFRDRPYYEESGGGMTVSGGEPGCQPEFAAALVHAAAKTGVHCAVETNACAPYSFYTSILPAQPLMLADYKLTDPEQHVALTGATRQTVTDTIARLAADGARIVLTCPIIPGINDNAEHFRAIARLSQSHANILGFLLRPYHAMGRAKAEEIGKTQAAYPVPSDATVRSWSACIREFDGKEYQPCLHA